MLESKNFGNLLVAFVVSLNTIWVCFVLFYNNYFGLNFIGSLLYPSADCTFSLPPIIGVHCFNDVFWPILAVQQQNPWALFENLQIGGNSSMLLIFLPFAGVAKFSGNMLLAVVLYLGLMAISISITAWHASKEKSLISRLIITSLFGALSFPALIALDRGNSVGFTVLPLYFFLYFLNKKEYQKAGYFLLISSIIKPQFLLVFVLFLFFKQFKVFFVMGITFLVVNFLTYLIWFAALPTSIFQSISTTSTHGDDPASLIYGYEGRNISIWRGVYIAINFFLGRNGASNGLGISLEDLSGWLPNISLGLIIIFILYVQRKYLDPVLLAGIAIISFALLPKLTAAYYSLAVLPLALMIFKQPNLMNLKEIRIQRTLSISIFLMLICSLTRFVIPINNSGEETYVQSSDLIPLSTLTVLSVLVADRIFQKSKELK